MVVNSSDSECLTIVAESDDRVDDVSKNVTEASINAR
jgi:hypothetical protein